MNKKKLYENIMYNVKKELLSTLNESKTSKVISKRELSPLKHQVIYTNIELNEPIYSNVINATWYKKFVMYGGAVYVEKQMGMDIHTFICNTKESDLLALKWIQKNVPDYTF